VLMRMLVKVSILCLLVFVTLSLHTRRAEAQGTGYCGESCIHDDNGAPGCLSPGNPNVECVLLMWDCYNRVCVRPD
jgi:hypothetical protein